jgi:transposase
MGKPIPYDLRVKIIRDSEFGRSQSSIAAEIGYSKDAVKKILRQYRQKGEAALKADYSKCGKTSRRHFSDEMEAEIMRRKDELPGAGYVFSVLQEAQEDQRIPSTRSIQRRWAKAGNPRTTKRQRQASNTWTKEVHHTWQIDGKEQITLANGSQVSWVNIADEASSTVLHTEVFPPADNE